MLTPSGAGPGGTAGPGPPLPGRNLARRSLSGRRLGLGVWFLLMLIAALGLYRYVIIPSMRPVDGVLNASHRPVGLDFLLFYSAGTLVRDGRGAAAYEDLALSAAETAVAGTAIQGLRWPYPPAMLVPAAGLAGLPYLAALGLWLGLGLAALLPILWRIVGRAWLVPVLALSPAIAYTCMTGQAGLAAAAIAGAGFLLLEARPRLAGAVLALLTLKIQLALLIPFCLIAGRRPGALASFVLAAAALNILGVALAGWDTLPAFLANASKAIDYVAATPDLLDRTPTVFAALSKAGLPRGAALASQVGVALLAIAGLCLVWRRSGDLAWRSLAWAAAVPLSVPYVFDYDLVVLTLPLAAMAAAGLGRGFTWPEAGVMTLLWWAPVLILPLAQAAGLQLAPLGALLLLGFAAVRSGGPATKAARPA